MCVPRQAPLRGDNSVHDDLWLCRPRDGLEELHDMMVWASMLPKDLCVWLGTGACPFVPSP